MQTLFKQAVFIIAVFLVAPFPVTAQEQLEDLSFKSGTWTYNYFVGDQQVSYSVFREKLNNRNEGLANMFNVGKNMSITGAIIGGIGSFCLGYDIGTRLAGGKGNVALLAGGGTVMGVGLILYYVGEGKMKKTLTLYKNVDKNASLTVDHSFSGLGISLNF
ncbi:MAG: hypothetical protein LBL94_03880 [Prevotellaceae bacterium]|jgi:hypothetical protein|nr:hypothetical protein [Prevotellaceae bacterium]